MTTDRAIEVGAGSLTVLGRSKPKNQAIRNTKASSHCFSRKVLGYGFALPQL